MFDTDFAIRRICESGVNEIQARAIVREIVDAQNELASKRDMNDLEVAVKRDMNDFEVAVKRDMKDLEIAVKKDMESFRLELVNSINLLEKTTNLKFAGLYALMLIIASGVAKLVFHP